MRRAAALAAASLAASAAFAQTESAAASSAGSLVQATLGLALVLGLILAIAWVAKRIAPGTLRAGSLPVTIVASQSLGQRERVVVVEIADQWLVLGVAPGRVSALSSLPKGDIATPPATAAAPFAAALSRALGRRS
jgi:flagellar protein FliO/FliZ